MTKVVLALIAAFALTACGHRPDLIPDPVHVGIDPALLDPAACPAWPVSKDVIIGGTESEGVDYDLRGYEAYRCERSTRMAIRDQNARQKATVE